MTNGQINAVFLASCSTEMQNVILSNIAKHYGIATEQANEEVTDQDAECIMDYVTGQERAAINVIYQGFKRSL